MNDPLTYQCLGIAARILRDVQGQEKQAFLGPVVSGAKYLFGRGVGPALTRWGLGVGLPSAINFTDNMMGRPGDPNSKELTPEQLRQAQQQAQRTVDAATPNPFYQSPYAVGAAAIGLPLLSVGLSNMLSKSPATNPAEDDE